MLYKEPKKIKMKRNIDDTCTFSQVGERMDKSKFEPQKCLKKNRANVRRSDFN